MRNRQYRVFNNRILFKCPSCQKSARFSVRPGQNKKIVSCNTCGEEVKCALNRRSVPRTKQEGRVQIKRKNVSQPLFGDMIDISRDGACISLRSIGKTANVRPGEIVKLSCDWNRRLFGTYKYIVRNKKGQRIGFERHM